MISVIDILSIDHAMAWQPWAVFYFLLIGASVGAALLAVGCHIRGTDGRGALMAATALSLAAPLPLLADLHQPARFMHFYLSFAWDSVMWWGSWLLPLYVGGVALLAVGTALRIGRSWHGPLTALVGLLGIGILGYTAGEMTLVAARPLWHSAAFPILLTLTALTAGAGTTLVFDAVRGVTGPGRPVVVGGSALALVVLGLWMLADRPMAALTLEHEPTAMLGGLMVLGLAVPAVLGLIGRDRPALRVAAGLTAAFGALAFRWELFTGAQLMSKTETAFFGHAALTAPATLHAAIGSAGVLGLTIVAVVVLFTVLAPRGGRRTPA